MAQIPEYENQLQELMKKFAEANAQEDEETLQTLRPSINNEFWNVAMKIAEDLVVSEKERNLTFSKRQILVLGYALMGYGIPASETKYIREAREESKPSSRYDIRLMPNALNLAYRKFLNFDEQIRLKQSKSVISRFMTVTADFVRDQHLLHDSSAEKKLSPSDYKELLRINKEYDDLLKPIVEMEKVIKEQGLSKKEAITKFAELKEELSLIEKQRENIISKYQETTDITKSMENAKKGYAKIVDLVKDLEKTEKQYQESIRKVSKIDMQNAVKDEVKALKMLTNMSAQMCRIIPASIPLGDFEIATPVKLEKTLDMILEYDPDVFNNRQSKRDGPPAILLVPGIGNGMYDWANNRMIVPTMAHKNLVDSVANGIVMYRTDIDQQFNDRKLINSYRNENKERKDVRSIRKLRQMLIEDYLIWITKESQGYTVLDKEVREWFERNIAPKKNDVIIPKRLRNLPLKEVNRLQREIKGDTTEELYDLAILFSMKEEFQLSLDHLKKVLERDENFLPAYYSLGIIYRRLKKPDGKDMFLEYSKRAPQSWWSKKAVELATKYEV